MIVLDTDHVSMLKLLSGARRDRLVARLALAAGSEPVGIPVVVVEESMRGWLAALAKERKPHRQVFAYRELAALFTFFARFPIIAFDDKAADTLGQLGRIQIGTPDKKIAAIALANNALLLTANRRDFEQVPNLRFENWMDPPPAG
jgi:tRNA(fMet)-specific endonuclease VapC